MHIIITHSSLQSQLPQIRHSIRDYIHMDKHFFTIMIGKLMHSWSYLMLLTIRKLELYSSPIFQIQDPRIRWVTVLALPWENIISSRIELCSLECLTTLGVRESFDFKPLCHCWYWSHQHQHQDHDDPW